MKTILILFWCWNYIFSASPSTLTTADVTPPVAAFYLNTHICGELTIYCCCADGNMMVCGGIGISFSCIPGGPFQCTKDLADCISPPSDCEACCKPCRA